MECMMIGMLMKCCFEHSICKYIHDGCGLVGGGFLYANDDNESVLPQKESHLQLRLPLKLEASLCGVSHDIGSLFRSLYRAISGCCDSSKSN